jgi:hypothetical protein
VNQQFTDYSLITKEYKLGEAKGTVGIIGPKRMEYSKIIAAVTYVAEVLSKELKERTCNKEKIYMRRTMSKKVKIENEKEIHLDK